MARAPFEILNDDCIRLVIDEVVKHSGYVFYLRRVKALQNLSLVNKRMRNICRPMLFKSTRLSLGPHYGARATARTFKALAKANFMTSTLQSIKVDFEYGCGCGSYKVEFCNSFVAAVAAMPNLSELHLNLHHNEELCSALRYAFMTCQLALPVKTLKLSGAPNAAFVILACPSLETAIFARLNRKWERTLAPLPQLTILRRLEIETEEKWTARRLQDFIPYLKNAKELCLRGKLYKVTPMALAPQFKSLRRLKYLSMTSIQWHKPEFFPADQDPAEIALAFFQNCPKLRTFRLLHRDGTFKYGCVRGEGAAVDKIEQEGLKHVWYGLQSAF